MATEVQGAEAVGGEGEGVRRRDFINVAAVSFAGVGGLAVLAPLITQMNPSADVLAQATTRPSRPCSARNLCSCVT
jgi:ubiquinol-cytochrome c reductase iron-sulfur subunit